MSIHSGMPSPEPTSDLELLPDSATSPLGPPGPELPKLREMTERHLERYREFTDKASEVARVLAFGGIGVVWMFKVESAGGISIPRGLALPLWLLVCALALDLMHYLTGVFVAYFRLDALTHRRLGAVRATMLGLLHRYPPGRILFLAKCASLLVAYALLLAFLWRTLSLR